MVSKPVDPCACCRQGGEGAYVHNALLVCGYGGSCRALSAAPPSPVHEGGS
jgi:hypothetical protein